jgi:hypothetical protein
MSTFLILILIVLSRGKLAKSYFGRTMYYDVRYDYDQINAEGILPLINSYICDIYVTQTNHTLLEPP